MKLIITALLGLLFAANANAAPYVVLNPDGSTSVKEFDMVTAAPAPAAAKIKAAADVPTTTPQPTQICEVRRTGAFEQSNFVKVLDNGQCDGYYPSFVQIDQGITVWLVTGVRQVLNSQLQYIGDAVEADGYWYDQQMGRIGYAGVKKVVYIQGAKG